MRFSKLRLGSGSQIHYAERGRADGEPILFLHGWPDSWFSFSSVAAVLPERYRAFLLDQRGFGGSDRPPHGYQIRDFAADVAAFLDAAALSRATVVGHSFGSFVARAAAIAHPERVERVVLIGTGWAGSNEVTREVYASLADLADPVSHAFAREFQASTAHAPVPAEFFDRIVAESLTLPARLWREVLAGVIGYEDGLDLRHITMPVLVLWGDRDALFSREDQERLVAAIPRARLKIYRDIGHCPNWECPGEVAADLEAFIRET